MTIFHVVSNLNYSGTIYKTGDFIENELAGFEDLVKDGVLRIVEGAETAAQAAQIIAAEAEAKLQNEASAEAKAPKDTWGPQPNKTPEELSAEKEAANKSDKPVSPTNDAGEAILKFKVLPEAGIATADAIIAQGEVINFTAAQAAKYPAGTFELVEENQTADATLDPDLAKDL